MAKIKFGKQGHLELEISRLSGPQHVTAFAQDKLGLVPAKPHEIIILDPK